MRIVVDDKIPYIQGALEPFAEVVYLPGSKTTAEVVKDADAIITRTRTICNESLLSGSKVKIIASATIGYDHIDTDYCEKAGIKWTNAPGFKKKLKNRKNGNRDTTGIPEHPGVRGFGGGEGSLLIGPFYPILSKKLFTGFIFLIAGQGII